MKSRLTALLTTGVLFLVFAALPAMAVVYNVVPGTDQDDQLLGTSGADHISGMAGADDIKGVGGNDRLEGGEDDDTMTGANGKDKIWGNAGKDTLRGGSEGDFIMSASDGARDFVYCGDGTDKVSADARDAVQNDCENVSIVNKHDSGGN